jgi:hypothetical protein
MVKAGMSDERIRALHRFMADTNPNPKHILPALPV